LFDEEDARVATKQRERELARAKLARQAARKAEHRERARRRNRVIALVVGLVVLIGALSTFGVVALAGGGKHKAAATASPSPSFPPLPAGADPALKLPPKITVPKGTPPATLVTKDIIVGKGTTAKAGDNVAVNYVGVNYADGKEFDSSWKSNTTIPVKLGAGQVVKGFEQGIEGMKVGGRRQIIIPPALGYGANGAPPTIAKNETLVFVVDLLKDTGTK
jgi:peptidylprolyl isomerase